MKQQFATGPNSFAATLDDSPSVDAFSRLRVSQAQTIFEAQSQYCANCIRMESGASGTGVVPAHQSNSRLVLIQVDPGGAGGTSFHQSFQYFHYQPGKSHMAVLTGYFGNVVAGAVMRFGYGDNANGIFYEQNGTSGVQITLLSSTSGAPVPTTVTQSQWNLDKLDGTGSSGVTLDKTKDFILFIDLQFLGMGRVRVGFDIGGVLIYAHQFLCANTLTGPYMQTASLPIKAEIVAAAAIATPAVAYFKCATVCSEAGLDIGLGRDFSAEGTATAANGARTHILSIRPKLTFNGFTTRGVFVPDTFEILAGNTTIKWELVIGAAFTVNPTFASVSNFAFMEAGTGGTFNNLTNGIVVSTGYTPGGGAGDRKVSSRDVSHAYPITLDRSGAQRAMGTMSLLVTGIGSTSDCRAAFNWQELR